MKLNRKREKRNSSKIIYSKRKDDAKKTKNDLKKYAGMEFEIPTSLEEKINEFLCWFKTVTKNSDLKTVSNFIEKMAVWYELRYPDYEINKKICYSNDISAQDIDDIMFENNNYIKECFDKNSDAKLLEFEKLYNPSVFINSLPTNERIIFSKYVYNGLLFFNSSRYSAHLHLSANGIVNEAEYFDLISDEIKNSELENKHLDDVIKLLESRGLIIPDNSELKMSSNDAKNWKKRKEGILDCVMYRILERGGNRIGPRRALIFAKEFGRNIDIPMKYGFDPSDLGIKDLINEYIKAGGNADLKCYVDYFLSDSKNEPLQLISIREYLKECCNKAIMTYTLEEDKLHKDLATALSRCIDEDELNKALRVKRKLEKSKRKHQD